MEIWCSISHGHVFAPMILSAPLSSPAHSCLGYLLFHQQSARAQRGGGHAFQPSATPTPPKQCGSSRLLRRTPLDNARQPATAEEANIQITVASPVLPARHLPLRLAGAAVQAVWQQRRPAGESPVVWLSSRFFLALPCQPTEPRGGHHSGGEFGQWQRAGVGVGWGVGVGFGMWIWGLGFRAVGWK